MASAAARARPTDPPRGPSAPSGAARGVGAGESRRHRQRWRKRLGRRGSYALRCNDTALLTFSYWNGWGRSSQLLPGAVATGVPPAGTRGRPPTVTRDATDPLSRDG